MEGVDTYQDAAQLPAPDLHTLLHSERPEQRVWALWALALRSGGDIRELAAETDGETHAGVRRVRAIVLAAHGDLERVRHLAREDSDPRVRATARELLDRIGDDGDDGH